VKHEGERAINAQLAEDFSAANDLALLERPGDDFRASVTIGTRCGLSAVQYLCRRPDAQHHLPGAYSREPLCYGAQPKLTLGCHEHRQPLSHNRFCITSSAKSPTKLVVRGANVAAIELKGLACPGQEHQPTGKLAHKKRFLHDLNGLIW
jgi:hypothetical protein